MSAISVSSSSSFFLTAHHPVRQEHVTTTSTSTTSHDTSNCNPNRNPNPNPSNIRTTTLGRPLPLDTFFFWPPSASSFASFSTKYTNDANDASDTSRYSTDSDATMPVSTFAAPERSVLAPSTASLNFYTNSTYCVANTTANTSQWRPQSARSGRSNRSASPLFARWARRHHHQPQPLDLRPATDMPQGNNGSSGGAQPRRRTHARTRSGNLTRTASVQKRQSHAGLPPPLTREEFEGLPLAIQRKYFSTLERLRFAQESGTDRISQHYNEISSQNFKRRKQRQSRSASHFPVSQLNAADSLALANLPDKIKKKLFTGEEQVALERPARASVVLDAADEAVYKFGRKTGRNLQPDLELRAPSVSSRGASMDLPPKSPGLSTGSKMNSTVPDSFYESFRWLDEEDNLDLRLFLDDYHANLRDAAPSPTTQHRPSFRRHLSISKIPFGRSSISTSRPGTKDGMTSPLSLTHSPVSPLAAAPGHTRRKSRALSLITTKYTSPASPGAIDPDAAHYQDPEARLKLRVYLASPQKFDEAIEFGFPSKDVLSAPPEITKESLGLGKRQSRQKLADDSFNLRSFLADDDEDDDDDGDKLSLNSDQPSIADPESPKTPQPYEKPPTRPGRVSTDPIHMHVSKLSDASYVQVPVSSREMTLRMTLTRPDLRANEDQIYGWQKPGHLAGKRSQTVSHLRDDSTTMNVSYLGEGNRKESIEKVLAGIDHWNANEADNSVMKRIWNRVRRS